MLFRSRHACALQCLFTSALAVYTCAAFIFLVWLAGPATAANVPAAARNKTITISFITMGNAKNSDGQTHAFSNAISRIIYVSSTGRLFLRKVSTSADGRASRTRDIAPDDPRSGPDNRGNVQFQGNKLLWVFPYAMGARQITVSFDGGFTSCTASIIEGHAAGGIIKRIGADGVTYEMTSVTTSSPRCSIQVGNAFAN
jgi:hypothetical protein